VAKRRAPLVPATPAPTLAPSAGSLPAQPGQAGPGRGFDPRVQPPATDRPQPAPAHATPLLPQELARLKRRARRGPAPTGGPAQDEDESH
jgi:hypothetical protein